MLSHYLLKDWKTKKPKSNKLHTNYCLCKFCNTLCWTDATINMVIHHKEFMLLKILNTSLILAVIINDVNVAITRKKR